MIDQTIHPNQYRHLLKKNHGLILEGDVRVVAKILMVSYVNIEEQNCCTSIITKVYISYDYLLHVTLIRAKQLNINN